MSRSAATSGEPTLSPGDRRLPPGWARIGHEPEGGVSAPAMPAWSGPALSCSRGGESDPQETGDARHSVGGVQFAGPLPSCSPKLRGVRATATRRGRHRCLPPDSGPGPTSPARLLCDTERPEIDTDGEVQGEP